MLLGAGSVQSLESQGLWAEEWRQGGQGPCHGVKPHAQAPTLSPLPHTHATGYHLELFWTNNLGEESCDGSPRLGMHAWQRCEEAFRQQGRICYPFQPLELAQEQEGLVSMCGRAIAELGQLSE